MSTSVSFIRELDSDPLVRKFFAAGQKANEEEESPGCRTFSVASEEETASEAIKYSKEKLATFAEKLRKEGYKVSYAECGYGLPNWYIHVTEHPNCHCSWLPCPEFVPGVGWM